MAISNEALDAMVAAGMTAEQLVAVIKADNAKNEPKRAIRRQKNAERMRRARAHDSTAAHSRAQPRTPAGPPQLVVVSCGGGTQAVDISSQQDERTNKVEFEQKENPPHPLKKNSSSSFPSFEFESEKERSGNTRARGDSRFDEFWRAYPHKVGKLDAVRAYAKARKRVAFDVLMAGLARYVSKTDDRPWCNPSTWLNRGSWADKPAEARGNGQHRQFGGGNYSAGPSLSGLALDLARDPN